MRPAREILLNLCKLLIKGEILWQWSDRHWGEVSVAAPSTKLELWRVGGVAVGAGHSQLGATLPAEIHAQGTLELAFRAFHGFPRRAVERG